MLLVDWVLFAALVVMVVFAGICLLAPGVEMAVNALRHWWSRKRRRTADAEHFAMVREVKETAILRNRLLAQQAQQAREQERDVE